MMNNELRERKEKNSVGKSEGAQGVRDSVCYRCDPPCAPCVCIATLLLRFMMA